MTSQDLKMKADFDKLTKDYYRLVANCDHTGPGGESYIVDSYCTFCRQKIALNIYVVTYDEQYALFLAYRPHDKMTGPDMHVYKIGEADLLLKEELAIANNLAWNQNISRVLVNLEER